MAAKKSQQWLGDAIGVSKVTISDLERGQMRLDTDYMRRIAKALGVQSADLLALTDNPWSLSPEERAIIDRMRQATADQREQLARVADVVAPWRGPGKDDRAA
jgi:transcriptional regulator with XRE-family HTH domain